MKQYNKLEEFQVFEQEEYDHDPDVSFLQDEEFMKPFIFQILRQIAEVVKREYKDPEEFEYENNAWRISSLLEIPFPTSAYIWQTNIWVTSRVYAAEDNVNSIYYNKPVIDLEFMYEIISNIYLDDSYLIQKPLLSVRCYYNKKEKSIEYEAEDLYNSARFTKAKNMPKIKGEFDLLKHNLNKQGAITKNVKNSGIF